MAKRTCDVVEDGSPCENPHYGRGMCKKHYQRWQSHGDPLYCREITLGCKVDGCERGHYGHGYCAAHWKRWYASGSALPEIVIGEWKPVAVKDPEYAAYVARHRRVRRARGKAAGYACEHCGGPAAQWAQIHETDGEEPDHYKPLCPRCHSAYDGWYEKVRERRIIKGLTPAGVRRMRETRQKQWASYSDEQKAQVVARLVSARWPGTRNGDSEVIKDGQEDHPDSSRTGGTGQGSSDLS